MIKNRYKIIIILTILMMLNSILLGNMSRASISITSADLYEKEQFTNLLAYNGVPVIATMVVYKDGGVEYPAYCMNVELPGVGENGPYTASVNGFVTNVLVWKVITNGYPYKTYQELGCDNAEEAYLATKQAVYCALYGRDPNTYTAISANGQKCLNALKTILANAQASTATKVSSDITITPVSTKWAVDTINAEYVSVTYTAAAAAPMNTYTISTAGTLPEGAFIADVNNKSKTTFNAGDKFKVLIPIQNLKADGNFNINVTGKVNTKPVLYGLAPNSGLQDYALTAAIYEDGSGSLKTYYTKNATEITILKQTDDTKKPLSGVEFELLDKDQKVIYTSLVTNKEGEININNLLPGTYYVKETKTLEGYSLYDKLIEVKLDLNETSKVVVDNSKEDVKVETNKTETTQEVGIKSSTTTVTSEENNTISSKTVSSKVEDKTSIQTTVVLPKTGY